MPPHPLALKFFRITELLARMKCSIRCFLRGRFTFELSGQKNIVNIPIFTGFGVKKQDPYDGTYHNPLL